MSISSSEIADDGDLQRVRPLAVGKTKQPKAEGGTSNVLRDTTTLLRQSATAEKHEENKSRGVVSTRCPGEPSGAGQKKGKGLQDRGWLKKGVFLQCLHFFLSSTCFFQHVAAEQVTGTSARSMSVG